MTKKADRAETHEQDVDDDAFFQAEEQAPPTENTKPEAVPLAETKEPAAEDTGEENGPDADKATETESKEERGRIAAVKAEREKRQRAEEREAQTARELADLREKLARIEGRVEAQQIKQEPPQPESVPDPLDDPRGYMEYRERQLQQRLVTYDRRNAERQYGADKVKAAYEEAGRLFKAGLAPEFAELDRSETPFSDLMDLMAERQKREAAMKIAQEVGDAPDLHAWAVKNGYVKADAPPQQQAAVGKVPKDILSPASAATPSVPTKASDDDAWFSMA